MEPRVALTGPVQLELIAPYFAEAGYGVAVPGEIPDITYDVTSHDAVLASEIPGFRDPRLEKLAGCPYSLDGIRAIVDEFTWSLAAYRESKSKVEVEETISRLQSEQSNKPNNRTISKVLAVDADNTLWHGILSEDGAKALVPCTEFQRGLRALRDEGVVLVLLSKNDPGSIESACGRVLDIDLFAVRKVNWEPKAGNLLDACRELNLGVDSVVFVDDNPHERAQMKAHLPEVAVAPWNGWGTATGEAAARAERQLVRRLREYFFHDLGLTAEDRLRADDYRRRGELELERRKFADRGEYLASLGLWVEARPAEPRDLDRLAQMAAKTNQFNMTTIRRPRSSFAALLSSQTIEQSNNSTPSVFVFRAGDRFGEQGIVCYIVVDHRARRITDFVMSCRAMGRTLEHFAYRYVAERLGYAPPVDFVPTAKNAPARAFLDELAAAASPGKLRTWYSCQATSP